MKLVGRRRRAPIVTLDETDAPTKDLSRWSHGPPKNLIADVNSELVRSRMARRLL